MKITSSYAVEIKKQKMFDNTIKIYREAVSFLIGCFNKEWDSIQKVEGAKSRKSFAEKLIHTTKYSTAKYDFDAKFYKFPSYLRRAAIQAALGSVSSYYSSHKNREANGKVDREPKLQCDRFCFPAFYKTVMYEESNKPNQCYLKLYKNNDWVWIPIAMRATDVKYITKYWSHCEKSAPTLEKKYGKYFLRFAFVEKVELSETEIQDRRICAWGTSKLAFDGSGALERDETNRALATFASGKQYNCDLSASYNIGARYFVRELLKPLPAMVRSQFSANVPDVERRIQVTLATLKVLYPELKKLSTQAA